MVFLKYALAINSLFLSHSLFIICWLIFIPWTSSIYLQTHRFHDCKVICTSKISFLNISLTRKHRFHDGNPMKKVRKIAQTIDFTWEIREIRVSQQKKSMESLILEIIIMKIIMKISYHDNMHDHLWSFIIMNYHHLLPFNVHLLPWMI